MGAAHAGPAHGVARRAREAGRGLRRGGRGAFVGSCERAPAHHGGRQGHRAAHGVPGARARRPPSDGRRPEPSTRDVLARHPSDGCEESRARLVQRGGGDGARLHGLGDRQAPSRGARGARGARLRAILRAAPGAARPLQRAARAEHGRQGGIVMRHEDLRESTRLAAEKKVNKLETRLTPGEKSNRKRMAQVAAVYSVAQWVRSASDVLHEVRPDDVAKRRPAPHDKRVWASVEQSPRKVIRAMFDEALRRDPDKRRRWVVLVDGEPRQLRAVKAEARRAGVKVTIHPRCRARPRVRVEGGACARRREQREGGEVGGRAPPRVAHRSPPSRAPATTSQTARERGS